MYLRFFDVEHGACAMLWAPVTGARMAMIDSGDNATTGFRPSSFIKRALKRNVLDYLFITNADQDHISDLDGLWEEGIEVRTLYRNRSPEPGILRRIKELVCGLLGLTKDMERYLTIHRDYIHPVAVPFNDGMEGVTCEVFNNTYPCFTDTNNLSMVVFITYGTFTICFPGDLEEEGWLELLKNPKFVSALKRTTVLVASHHGRANGYCAEIFDHFTPRAVVISDKSIEHQTQIDVDYGNVVNENGVAVHGESRRRHVLTTRKDGDITFKVHENGDFEIFTEVAEARRAA
jgi:beta-lactamase superfamily II metal-dependent hydrolase